MAAAKCGSERLATLTEGEQLTHSVASQQAAAGANVTPLIAAGLIRIIERLDHELAHAHWGGLECDLIG